MSDNQLRARCADLFGTSKLCASLDAEDVAGFPLWCMFAPLQEVLFVLAVLEVEE